MEDNRINIRISDKLKNDLVHYCETHGGKMSSVIKVSLKHFLEDAGKPRTRRRENSLSPGGQIDPYYGGVKYDQKLLDEEAIMVTDNPISIYYTTLQTPIGKLYAGATHKGICCIALSESSWSSFLEEVGERFSINLSKDDSRLQRIKEDLINYFDGNNRSFGIPIDLFTLTSFQKKVLESTGEISYGTVKSYRDIAVSTGSPRASRAVGNALGKNPVPIVIPCHRVVMNDGSIGGFTGGLDKKRFLLKLEGGQYPFPLN